jgi:hypothetical protein
MESRYNSKYSNKYTPGNKFLQQFWHSLGQFLGPFFVYQSQFIFGRQTAAKSILWCRLQLDQQKVTEIQKSNHMALPALILQFRRKKFHLAPTTE